MTPTYVTSLELSKKLKKAGYPQEGEFWWIANIKSWDLPELCYKGYLYQYQDCNKIVAPLASELMERLPIFTWICKHDINGEYAIQNEIDLHKEYDNNLCNTLAKMYIYLVEQRLLKEK